MFSDRNEAAERLAGRLEAYRGKHPLVLAIPRGAVPMAKIIADRLAGEFDVVLARKLRAPFDPKFAIGAVDEGGWLYLSDAAASVGADAAYIASEKQAQMDVIGKRRAAYTPLRPPRDPAGRAVIVVDDGLATGATMIAALHGVRARRPARLICAVPVAPPETLARVSPLADETVCLETPADFRSVGQYYRHFPQIEDREAIELLKDA